ncbi:MAG: glutamate racemase [Phenylobacterium sp.]|jgi:glutamate racemase
MTLQTYFNTDNPQQREIMIIDSGLGGLSVCAQLAARFIQASQAVKLIYVNAAPSDETGYDDLGDTEAQTKYFSATLEALTQRWQPEQTLVACNTLSALMPQLISQPTPLTSVIDCALAALTKALKQHYVPTKWPDLKVVLFATPTTIYSSAYAKRLTKMGLPPSALISQPCPGLATAISNDVDTLKAKINQYVGQALDQLSNQASQANDEQQKLPVAIILGCTHYGYRQDLFHQAIELYYYRKGHRDPFFIVVPNQQMAMQVDLLSAKDPSPVSPQVEFYSRYEVPKTEVDTVSQYLSSINQQTADALCQQIVDPTLF